MHPLFNDVIHPRLEVAVVVRAYNKPLAAFLVLATLLVAGYSYARVSKIKGIKSSIEAAYISHGYIQNASELSRKISLARSQVAAPAGEASDIRIVKFGLSPEMQVWTAQVRVSIGKSVHDETVTMVGEVVRVAVN